MRLLMCPPDYFGIEYEINPWMSRSRQSHPQLAREQWEKLYGLLRVQLAAAIEIIEPKPNLPDMVFTANAGLVWQNHFIASQFRPEVRRGESYFYETWFGNQGFEIHHLPENHYFEGEGDLLRCGELWFAGYHTRSDIRAHQKVSEILEQEILSLELTSQWFYHLDTCFCPLGPGRALFYPEAFDTYGRKVLETHISELVAVSGEEAARFACNAIVSNKTIVINEGSPVLGNKLEGLGYKILTTPLDEFIKAGGSAKCLVLTISA